MSKKRHKHTQKRKKEKKRKEKWTFFFVWADNPEKYQGKWFLTVGCSSVFADCSFTLGSASPNNTAGTNALQKNKPDVVF